MYGLVIFAQAIVSYLVILVNFGFNTFAIKEISINRENQNELNIIVSTVLTLKAYLFIISLIVLFIALKFIPQAKGHEKLFFLTMWMCLYDFIFPIWYFQGIEKMKYITYLTVINKSVYAILLFVLIKSQNDYLLVPIINGIGVFISGIFSLLIIFKSHDIRFTFPNFSQLKQFMHNSLSFFIADVSVRFFAGSNKIIIGVVMGMAEVAYIDLAEKIVSIFRTVPLGIVRDTIYPKVAKTRNIKIVRYTSLGMGIYSLIAIAFISIFAPTLVILLGGRDMLLTVNILRILSISIFTTHISNYYITVGLWSWGFENLFRNLMIYSSILFLLIYAIIWSLNLINLYTITLVPILVDLYLIIHTYLIFKHKKLL